MCDNESDGDSSGVECPECGDEFANQTGAKIHHKKIHGESLAGFDINCDWCGETITVTSEPDGRNFCNRDCMGMWRSENIVGEKHPNWNPVQVSCAWCGKSKRIKKSEYEESERHFCDHGCYGRWRSEYITGENTPSWKGGDVEVRCAYCGDPKYVSESRRDYRKRHFCDRSCLGEWLSENNTGKDHPRWVDDPSVPYGNGFTEKKKEEIRQSQDGECAGCGRAESENGWELDVHHVEKARTFEDSNKRNSETNLVALCRSCHLEWEQMSPLQPQTTYLD